MISKTESGQVGYRKKYQVAGRVRVPAVPLGTAHAVFTSNNSRECESHKMQNAFGAKQSRRPHASPRERGGHVDNFNCMKEG